MEPQAETGEMAATVALAVQPSRLVVVTPLQPQRAAREVMEPRVVRERILAVRTETEGLTVPRASFGSAALAENPIEASGVPIRGADLFAVGAFLEDGGTTR